MLRLLAIVSIIALFAGTVRGSCKAFEGDPYAPHILPPDFKRLYTFGPDKPNTDPYDSYYLDVTSYNIQSGLSLTCSMNFEQQATILRGSHLYGLQEVDIDVDLHCNCQQPQVLASLTGHTVEFLCTIPYRTGLYGSALGTVFPVLETRFLMFKSWTTEMRGVTAIRLTPPQLAGKTLWFLNTHFQYDNETTRVGQAYETVQFATDLAAEFPEAYFIVTGDWYTVVGAFSYTVLANYFQNAWVTYSLGLEGGFTFPSDVPVIRYDNIWYKAPPGANVVIHAFTIPQVQYSDHLPIHATFDFGLANPSGSLYYPSTAGSYTSSSTASGVINQGSSSSSSSSSSTGSASTSTSAAATTGQLQGTSGEPQDSSTRGDPQGNTGIVAPSTTGQSQQPTAAPTASPTSEPTAVPTAPQEGTAVPTTPQDGTAAPTSAPTVPQQQDTDLPTSAPTSPQQGGGNSGVVTGNAISTPAPVSSASGLLPAVLVVLVCAIGSVFTM